MNIATCTYFIKDGKVLLPRQIEKIIGRKGYGGKLKNGQTIRSNAIEEIGEESGLKKELRINPEENGGIIVKESDLQPIAFIDFYNGDKQTAPFGNPSFRVYFFLCTEFSGIPIATKEMVDPKWYSLDQIPLDELVKGDPVFVPRILNQVPLKGHIRRSNDWSSVLENTLKEYTLESLNF